MDVPHDAIAAVTHADPYPWYAASREARPLYFDEGLRLWVAGAPAVVAEALRHPLLRVRPAAEPVPPALQGRPVGEVFARLVRMNDGAFHAAHRPAVERAAQAFAPAAVRDAARAAAADLFDRVDANAWTWSVPVQAMARLLGVATPDLDATVAAVHAFTLGIAPAADEAALARADAGVIWLMAQGAATGLDEVRSANRIAFMQQSLDATSGWIGNALVRLGASRVVPDAAFMGAVLRDDPPIHNTRRFAAGDLVLAGQAVRGGDGMLLLLAAAQLGFGAGAHACPGERIAGAIALEAVAFACGDPERMRRFERAVGYRPLPNARIPVFAT
jgi:cytochrome P450